MMWFLDTKTERGGVRAVWLHGASADGMHIDFKYYGGKG